MISEKLLQMRLCELSEENFQPEVERYFNKDKVEGNIIAYFSYGCTSQTRTTEPLVKNV